MASLYDAIPRWLTSISESKSDAPALCKPRERLTTECCTIVNEQLGLSLSLSLSQNQRLQLSDDAGRNHDVLTLAREKTD